MLYIAYLDEFGHIGPFVSRQNSRYKESPVFGLAGYIIPADRVRYFATWFFKRKCELLQWEIKNYNHHPAKWEKKGSQLYTITNITRYAELRMFTHRFCNQLIKLDARLIYYGMKKRRFHSSHNPRGMYIHVLINTLALIDDYCCRFSSANDKCLIVMDDHDDRSLWLEESARQMFGGDHPLRHILEPPFEAESHMYQTLQAADWIAGLLGRLGCLWTMPNVYSDYEPFRAFEQYFQTQAVCGSKIENL